MKNTNSNPENTKSSRLEVTTNSVTYGKVEVIMELFWVPIIYLGTFIFSFGIQFSSYVYLKITKSRLLDTHKSVLDYTSGIVGDALLIPLVNVFCFLTIWSLGLNMFLFEFWRYALIIGLIVTFLFHYAQMKWQLINWTMPKVGVWSLLGIYHSIFMFFEISILAYTLIILIWVYSEFGVGPFSPSPLKYAIVALLLFLASFIYDYRQVVKLSLGKKDSTR